MDKYTLSIHPDVIALTGTQEKLALNDKDFCRRVGFTLSPSSWGKIKAGTYAGNCHSALQVVQRALKTDMRETVPVVDAGIVLFPHILTAADAVTAARAANDEHRLVIVVGKAGSGKSKTAAYLGRKFGGTLIHATSSWEKKYLHALTSIGQGLGIGNSWRSAGEAERAILQSLQVSPRLIIIDEANHFNRSTLNFLKTVLNTTRCCLVLLTLPHHIAKMAADSREEFPQLLRRAGAIIHIPVITGEEVRCIQKALYPEINIKNFAPIYSLANTLHNMDTVRRILDEMDAGLSVDEAVENVRRQIQIYQRSY